tara:strand:+ start:1787 stop:2401 length:615 start_codon:yes stop_codon:yes gene_type:complete
MSKTKKRIRKALMAGAALYGASKLMSSSIAKNQAAKALKGDKFAKARKAMTSNEAYRGKPGNLSKFMGMDRKKSTIAKLQDESLTNLNTRTKSGNINRMKLYAAKKKAAEDAAAAAKAKLPKRTGQGPRRFSAGGPIKAKQGYYAREDESIAMRRKKKRTKKQLVASRNESYGKWGKRGKKIIKARGGTFVQTKLNGDLYTETF